MFTQTPPKRELFASALRRSTSRVFAIVFVTVLMIVATSVIPSLNRLTGTSPLATQKVSAATASTINFQARLQNAAGNIAPDGSYNVEFKLYNVSSGGSTLWTEDYLNSNTQGVSVSNGYLTVNLGSITSFPGTIKWDQDLWLTMTVRGTGSCAFASCTPADAEMSPRLKLTSVPYAFKAGQLAQYNSGTGFTSTLSLVNPTVGDQVFQIQDQGAAGTYNLLTQNQANTNYIQNQSAGAQSTSAFWISGTGRADTSLITPTVDTTTSGGTLVIGSTNSNTGAINIGLGSTTGTITIGGTAQTGTLTVGSSTGTNTLNIANGSGATTVNIANVQTAGSVNIGAAMTTGTITIGGTGAQTGTIGIGTGTGAQQVNVGSGTGLKTISIGGTGANVIGLGNTQTAGSISLGAAMTTGTITIGGTGAQTGTIGIGTGTGAQSLNFGTGGTGAKTVTIGSTASTGTTTIQGGSGGIVLSGAVTGSSISLSATSGVAATFQGASGQDIVQFKQNGGAVAAKLDSTGNLITSNGITSNFTFNANSSNIIVSTTNTNTSSTVATTNGQTINLTGTNNSNAGGNVLNGVNFSNVTAATNNVFYGLNFGTGYNDILRYNGTQLISGTGILQSAAVNGTYGNLTGTGALNAGSITSGFGSIDTGADNITTTGTLQGTTSVLTSSLDRVSGGTLSIGTSTATGITIGSTSTTTGTIAIQGSSASTMNLQAGSGGINLSVTDGTLTTAVALTPTLGLGVGGSTNVTYGLGSTIAASGTMNNLCLPTGSAFRFTAGANYTITGINGTAIVAGAGGAVAGNSGTGATNCGAAGTVGSTLGAASGRMITIINASTSSMFLSNNSGSSTVGNRLNTGVAGTQTIRAGGSIGLMYDLTSQVWRTVGDGADTGGGVATCTTCATTALDNLASTNINAALNTTGANLTLQTTTSGNIVLNSVGTIELQDATNVTGTLNATTGFKFNGTSGSTTTCSGGNILQNAVVQGGIITGGTCVANGAGAATNLQNTYDNSSTTDPQIQLSATNGGFKIRDASSTVGNILQIQNSTGGTTYFAVTNSATSVGGNLSVTGTYNGNTFSSSALTFSAASSTSIQSAAGQALTVDSGTTGQLNLGTTGSAKTIQIGNTSAAIAQTVNIGNNATASSTNTVNIGNLLSTSATTIQGGTGASAVAIKAGSGGTISIANSGVANTVQIGTTTGAVTQTLNIGNNATASSVSNVTIGSTIGASATTIQAGSNGIALTGDVTGSTTINSVSGFKYNGTVGVTVTACTGGQVLTNIGVSGGIITSAGGCATNGGGVSPTMQNVYDNSGTTNPQIQLSATNGGLKVRDASSTVGNIIQVQNSGGTTTYFAVTSTGLQAAALDTATAGTLSLGISTANAVSLGNSSATTTVNGNLSVASGKTVTLQGATSISTTSSTALLIQDGSSNALLTANTSGMTVVVGNSGNTITMSTSGLLLAGTARSGKTIRLSAEYPGTVLDTGGIGNNSGTMTSGFDMTNRMNYYDWTTTSGSAQTYDVVVQMPVPSDWSAWSGSIVNFTTYTTSTTNGTATVEVIDSAGTTATGCHLSGTPTNITPGSNVTWSTNTTSCSISGGTYTAGDYLTIRIRLSAVSNAHVRVGNITTNYLAKF